MTQRRQTPRKRSAPPRGWEPLSPTLCRRRRFEPRLLAHRSRAGDALGGVALPQPQPDEYYGHPLPRMGHPLAGTGHVRPPRPAGVLSPLIALGLCYRVSMALSFDPQTQESWSINQLLFPNQQADPESVEPTSIRQSARYLADELEADGREGVEIRVESLRLTVDPVTDRSGGGPRGGARLRPPGDRSTKAPPADLPLAPRACPAPRSRILQGMTTTKEGPI